MISILKKLSLLRKQVGSELFRLEIKHRWIRQPMLALSQRFLKLKTLTREDMLNRQQAYRLRRFGQSETVRLKRPVTIGSMPATIEDQFFPPLFNYDRQVTFDRPFVCEVRNAELVGSTAIGLDRDRNILLETTIPHFLELDTRLTKALTTRSLFLRVVPLRRKRYLNTACSLAHLWNPNYWHWMADTLTRLEGVEHYKAETGRDVKLVIASKPKRWQLQSLQLLGYTSEDLIHCNQFNLRVKRLIVPSIRRYDFRKHYHGFVSAQACRWVAQRMRCRLPDEVKQQSFSPNILVSRRRAAGRRIANEHVLLDILRPFGFVPYVLEDLSLAEQVQLFSQARMVIAPHGAGLTNIIFGENLKVIELFRSFVVPTYYHLAQGMGFQYGYLMGATPSGEWRSYNGDMVVDPIQLRQLVIQMLESDYGPADASSSLSFSSSC